MDTCLRTGTSVLDKILKGNLDSSWDNTKSIRTNVEILIDKLLTREVNTLVDQSEQQQK